ncbi:MAG: flavodoxin family protein [Clostridia bacterium]|nr:flavodoxin family protein [Clostridia bacterium]
MKIGIIVHSVTGNTLAVSKKLEQVLREAGHGVELKEIRTEGKPNSADKEVKFSELPALDGYDALVFGSHTEAFSLEFAMKEYFGRIDGLKGRNAACLITHQLPCRWMGGNNAARQMKRLCEDKGAKVIGTAIVEWSPENKRQQKIDAAVELLAGLFA